MNKAQTKKEFVPDNTDYSKIYSPSKLKMFEQCPKQYDFSYLDPIYKPMKRNLQTLPINIWSFQTIGKAVEQAITLFYYLPTEKRTQDALLLHLQKTWRSEAKPNQPQPLGQWGGFKSLEEERACYREAQQMLRNF